MIIDITIDESNREGLIGAFGMKKENGDPIPEAEQNAMVKSRIIDFLSRRLKHYYIAQFTATAELPEIVIS